MAQAKLTSYFASRRKSNLLIVQKNAELKSPPPISEDARKRKHEETFSSSKALHADTKRQKSEIDNNKLRRNSPRQRPESIASCPKKRLNLAENKSISDVTRKDSSPVDQVPKIQPLQKESSNIDIDETNNNAPTILISETSNANSIADEKDTNGISPRSESHQRAVNKSVHGSNSLIAAFDRDSYTIPKPVSPLPPSPKRNQDEPQASSCAEDKIASKAAAAHEFRNRIKKCGTIQDLRKQLLNLSSQRNKPKVVETKATQSVEKTGNASSSINTEEKKEPVPAYQRFHNLAQPSAPSLSLPYKYKLLEEMFRSTDTIVAMLHNRHEKCSFKKLKPGVQEMLRKNFELQHLAQIRKVFEEAYTYEQERESFASASNYQLVIAPSFNYLRKDVAEPNGEKLPSDRKNPVHMTSSVLLERRGLFHNRLIDVVQRHHEEFLSRLSPPVVVPKEKLKRWHPNFNVDMVPDVEQAPLPEGPNIKHCVSAKDILAKAQGLYSKRIEDALKIVANKHSEKASQNNNEVIKPSILPGLKGIPTDLLNKIRAKEAVKIKKDMVRDPAEERKLLLLSRLPELARILRNYFITEKKSALPMLEAITKVANSCSSGILLTNVEEHIRFLSNLVPKWLSIITLRKGIYLKMDRDVDLKTVIEEILKHKDTLKNV